MGIQTKTHYCATEKTVRIIAFWPYISHSTSVFNELQILIIKDFHYIQFYIIYYKNVNKTFCQLIFEDLSLQ